MSDCCCQGFQEILCDIDEYGDTIQQFLRRWIYPADDAVYFLDTELDGETAYVPTGVAQEQCCCDADTANISPTVSSTTTSGSTTAGIWRVSITNVGGAAGTVAGASIPAGMTVPFEGYYDEQFKSMERLAAISYDATGTTFVIAETP